MFMLTWGESHWGEGMTLEKSKGAFLCLRGGIHGKEKPLSVGTRSEQDALSLDPEVCAGLGGDKGWY